MRLLVTMIVRDEADRYLDPVLDWLVTLVTPHVAVYDDGSIDNTVAIARDYGCHVAQRPDKVPALLQCESAARAAAWEFMEETFEARIGDWALSIDADEFFVSDSVIPEAETLVELADEARTAGVDAVAFPRAEVFGYDGDGTPMIRTDGQWGKLWDRRFVRWMANGLFAEERLAGGSLPSYARTDIRSRRATVLHMGYARAEDQRVKHDRYSTREGHGSAHVRSILAPGTLTRWRGKVPMLGGRRDDQG